MSAPTLADEVFALFGRALFDAAELAEGTPSDAVLVEGVVSRAGFHPGRLEAARAEVLALLERIVTREFWDGQGGGWTFLNLVVDARGELWGEHRNAEQLYLLAAGLGLAEFLIPREHWDMLPGGMPYLVFRRAPRAGKAATP